MTILEHTKQVKVFSESNIPTMLEQLVEECTDEITEIRSKE